LINFEQFL